MKKQIQFDSNPNQNKKKASPEAYMIVSITVIEELGPLSLLPLDLLFSKDNIRH